MNFNSVNDLTQNVDLGIRTRAELLEKINKSIRKLNEDFIANPQEINTQKLRELISQLVETNKYLEEQKQGLRETWWSQHGNKVTLLMLGITCLGAVSLAVSSFFQFTPSLYDVNSSNQNTCSPTTTNTNIFNSRTLQAVTALIVLGIVCEIVGVGGTYIAKRKNNKEEEVKKNLYNVMQVKQVGEEYLDKILEALEEFKQQSREERDPIHIQRCVRALEKIPKNGDLEKIKKENLVPLMIEELPDNNPLFINYTQLKSTVNHKTLTDSSIEPFEHPSDEDDISFGETATAAASLPGLKSKLSNHPRLLHRELWSQIENGLGVKLKKIRIDGKYLHRDGRVDLAHRQIIPVISDTSPFERVIDIDEINEEFERNQTDLFE